MGSAGGAGSSQGYARIGIDRRRSREPRIQRHRMFVSTNGSRGLLPPVEAVASDCARVEEINRRRLAGRKTTYTELPPGANHKLSELQESDLVDHEACGLLFLMPVTFDLRTIVMMQMRWILKSAWRVSLSLAFFSQGISMVILDSLYTS